jgi:hypothetical protein
MATKIAIVDVAMAIAHCCWHCIFSSVAWAVTLAEKGCNWLTGNSNL